MSEMELSFNKETKGYWVFSPKDGEGVGSLYLPKENFAEQPQNVSVTVE